MVAPKPSRKREKQSSQTPAPIFKVNYEPLGSTDDQNHLKFRPVLGQEDIISSGKNWEAGQKPASKIFQPKNQPTHRQNAPLGVGVMISAVKQKKPTELKIEDEVLNQTEEFRWLQKEL